MSSGKISMPASLKTSSLSNLSRTAMTRSVNVAAEVLFVDPEECYAVVNPRKEFNQELIDSYAAEFLDPKQGQREPCHVYPKDDNGYRIHHGATRRLAAIKAKATKPDFKLKVIVDNELLKRSDAENFFEQGSNNINRDNMTVFDQADWIEESIRLAKKEGVKLTLTEVAEKLAMSKSKVSRIYALRNASQEIRDVYESRTQDPETLINLVKIRETNQELFNALLKGTELDRATVREAAKSGQLPVVNQPGSADDSHHADVQPETTELQENQFGPTEQPKGEIEIAEFVAHAQQELLKDIELSTGNVTIYTNAVEGGFAAVATTDFPANRNMKLEHNRFKVWDSAETALNQVYLDLSIWVEKVEREGNLHEEQIKDIMLLSGFLGMRLVISPEKATPSTKKEPKAKVKPKASFITGSWKGQECTLVSDLSLLSDHELETIASSDMVYVDGLEDGRKLIKAEEFTLKCVKFKD